MFVVSSEQAAVIKKPFTLLASEIKILSALTISFCTAFSSNTILLEDAADSFTVSLMLALPFSDLGTKIFSSTSLSGTTIKEKNLSMR